MTFTSEYTYEQKLEACNAYVTMFGSSIKAAKYVDMPAQTLRGWTKTQWWEDMVLIVRKSHQNRIDGKFSGMLETTLSGINERLQNGDEVVHAKTGEMLRKKVSARDMADIANKVYMLRSLGRGEPTSRSEKMTVDKKLSDIQDTLHAAGKAKTPPKEVEIRH
jgi:hypothetical protein|tara:strand:+ start:117 stop:605 length:489 start_codon:yes stop_codon:yes gene_type:complete